MDEKQIRERIAELENELTVLNRLLPAVSSRHGYYPYNVWDISGILVSFNKPKVTMTKKKKIQFRMVEDAIPDK